jgi:hypothetical protein
MQKDYKKYNVSPYRLLATKYSHLLPLIPPDDNEEDQPKNSGSSNSYNQSDNKSYDDSPKGSSSTNSNEVSPTIRTSLHAFLTSSKSNSTADKTPSNFAERFHDEIAPRKKMEEYNQLAQSHKDKLLKESKLLHKKYNEEITQAYHMEHTVGHISALVLEFSRMIESQSEVVQTVEIVTKDVTKSVESTDEELIRTLERSQSHSWNMMILMVVLSFLLLLLHILTP